MKNLLSLSLLVIMACSIFSCQKDVDNLLLTKDQTIGKIDLSRDINDWESQLNHYASGKNEDGNYYEAASCYISNENSFQKFVALYKGLTGNQNSPRSIVFYTTKPPKLLSSLSKENIFAFSVFSNFENKLYHNLYIKDNNDFFVENNHFFAEINNVKTDVPHFLLLNILKPLISNELSYLLVSGQRNINQGDSRDHFAIKNALYLEQSNTPTNSNLRVVPGGGGSRCPSPCQEDIDGDCEEYEEGLMQCIATPCGLVIVKDEVSANSSLTTSFIDSAFVEDLLYELRDSFLLSSTFGTKYVNYFYGLSAILDGNIDLTTAVNTALLLPEVNTAATKLLDPITYGNDVLISSGFAEDLKDLLNDYRSLSTNNDYQDTLDDIEDDIDLHKGKTVSQLINFL